MEEIKFRYQHLKLLLEKADKNPGYAEAWLILESISIQYRKIVELIAFSSIVANEKEYRSIRNKAAKDWKAEYIFNDIERVNANFYPTPIKGIIESKNPDQPDIIDEYEDGFLTRENATELYEKCSRLLHAENRLSQPLEHSDFIDYFKTKEQELFKLLHCHWVTLIPESLRYLVYVQLNSPKEIEIYGAEIGGK